MKWLIFVLMFLPAVASAAVVSRCAELAALSNRTTDYTSSVFNMEGLYPDFYRAKHFTAVAISHHDSGTSTLDVSIQSCRTSAAGNCSTLVAFDQCTTSCYGGDDLQNIDLNADGVNLFPYLRAVIDVGASGSPQYDITVRICWSE